MNKLIYTGILALLVSCGTAKMANDSGMYGPVAVDPAKAVSVTDMLTTFNKTRQEQEFTFEGKISSVCQNAGCWVQVDKGNGETFMVRFKDHFTIPTNTPAGSAAVLHGIAYMDTVTVEQLQHFAYDAGKTEEEIAKITEPVYKLNFEADGIMLRKEATN